LQLQI